MAVFRISQILLYVHRRLKTDKKARLVHLFGLAVLSIHVHVLGQQDPVSLSACPSLFIPSAHDDLPSFEHP